VCIACVSVACGGSDSETDSQNEDSLNSATAEEGIVSQPEFEDSTGATAGGSAESPKCGNKVVDELEQCDDGNSDDEDGCTSLCGYTCESDGECSDGDPCNGDETCSVDHTCVPSGGIAEDGESCGNDASCLNGECFDHICNNGIVQPGEECDDGDDKDDNGCTRRCEYTCKLGDALSPNVNECTPFSTCDEASHTWQGGQRLEDGIVCGNGDGYCQSGVCILSICGDGVVEPNEECDLGDQNGVEDSGCSASCTTAVCGDGVIGGSETCDDGPELVNLDGCNSKCRAEVTYRGTRLQLSVEDAPDFCVHANNENKGNAFAELFNTEEAAVDLNIHSLMNTLVAEMLASGEINALFHLIDVEDFSSFQPDPLTSVGLSMGQPKDDWVVDVNHMDTEFYAYRDYFDDDLNPLTVIPTELLIEDGKQIVQSTKSNTAGFVIAGVEFILHDAMARVVSDGNLRALPAPPEVAEGLQTPESVGGNGEDPPEGVICGAIHQDSFATIPLPEALTMICLDQLGQYDPCAESENPTQGECDSALELFKGGCTAGADLLPILKPLGEPDVDSDGDGEADSYSCVLRVSAERVKVIGVMERPPTE